MYFKHCPHINVVLYIQFRGKEKPKNKIKTNSKWQHQFIKLL